ncbi:MAG: L-threonylcarbamoyladenylate synthase [Rhodospirillales bacterium]
MNAPPIRLPADAAAIAEAAALLHQGRLVAFPTETVYGLGANARDDAAVAAVFAVKNRPRFNPLIVHVPDLAAAETLAAFDDRACFLAGKFWPGPLTLVLPRRAESGLSPLVSAGLDTVAVRAPAHPIAQALLAAARLPVAAPSANPSGRVSPTTAAHVAESLGQRVALILDGGPCRVGVESTVVGLTGETPVLLRPGGLAAEAIERYLGPLARPRPGAPQAPGLLARHYAPGRPLRLYAHRAQAGEALLAFGPEAADADLNLSARGDLEEAAANLFAMLRILDRPAFSAIAVMPIPDAGLGRAINDRLRRAAAAGAADDGWNDERGPAAPCVLPGLEEDES